MLVVVGDVVFHINILCAVWNLATIVGKTILSRVNIARPCRADLEMFSYSICWVHLHPTCGCGVGSKARTAPEKAVAIQRDNILKLQKIYLC